MFPKGRLAVKPGLGRETSVHERPARGAAACGNAHEIGYDVGQVGGSETRTGYPQSRDLNSHGGDV